MQSLVLFYSTMPDKPAVEFTPSKRGCILALRDKKYSYHNIALKVGDFTASAMWKTVQQELKHHTQHSLPCPGHPPALSDAESLNISMKTVLCHFWMPPQC